MYVIYAYKIYEHDDRKVIFIRSLSLSLHIQQNILLYFMSFVSDVCSSLHFPFLCSYRPIQHTKNAAHTKNKCKKKSRKQQIMIFFHRMLSMSALKMDCKLQNVSTLQILIHIIFLHKIHMHIEWQWHIYTHIFL